MKIKKGRVERLPNRYSEELNRVVAAMLNVDYKRRPSTSDLIQLPPVAGMLGKAVPESENERP